MGKESLYSLSGDRILNTSLTDILRTEIDLESVRDRQLLLGMDSNFYIQQINMYGVDNYISINTDKGNKQLFINTEMFTHMENECLEIPEDISAVNLYYKANCNQLSSYFDTKSRLKLNTNKTLVFEHFKVYKGLLNNLGLFAVDNLRFDSLKYMKLGDALEYSVFVDVLDTLDMRDKVFLKREKKLLDSIPKVCYSINNLVVKVDFTSKLDLQVTQNFYNQVSAYLEKVINLAESHNLSISKIIFYVSICGIEDITLSDIALLKEFENLFNEAHSNGQLIFNYQN